MILPPIKQFVWPPPPNIQIVHLHQIQSHSTSDGLYIYIYVHTNSKTNKNSEMQPQQTTCTTFYQNHCNKSQKQLQLGIRKLRKKKNSKQVSVYMTA